MNLQEKAKRQITNGIHDYEYFGKLSKHELTTGLDVPVFEIVNSYKMVKNAVCIKTPVENGIRYIVKHYDTIILQWVMLNKPTFEKFVYNCSPTSNRQIDSIMSVIAPDIPRSQYKEKIPVYTDDGFSFKQPLSQRV